MINMTAILATPLTPIPQTYFDLNGAPLSLGFVTTYIPGTSNKKITWSDAYKVGANQNPLQLTASGTALIYADGDYRVLVQDVNLTTISDTIQNSFLPTSAISPALAPVVAALTKSTARTLLGVDTEIQNAINLVQLLTGPTGPQGVQGPSGPIGPTGSSASSYSPTLISTNPGSLQVPNVNGGSGNCFFKWGQGTSANNGRITISFDTPFPNLCFMVIANANDAVTGAWTANASGWNQSSFNVTTASWVASHLPGGPQSFTWWAVGN